MQNRIFFIINIVDLSVFLKLIKIHAFRSEAFDTSDEEKLFRLLHTDHQSLISLVAETDDNIV